MYFAFISFTLVTYAKVLLSTANMIIFIQQPNQSPSVKTSSITDVYSYQISVYPPVWQAPTRHQLGLTSVLYS